MPAPYEAPSQLFPEPVTPCRRFLEQSRSHRRSWPMKTAVLRPFRWWKRGQDATGATLATPVSCTIDFVHLRLTREISTPTSHLHRPHYRPTCLNCSHKQRQPGEDVESCIERFTALVTSDSDHKAATGTPRAIWFRYRTKIVSHAPISWDLHPGFLKSA